MRLKIKEPFYKVAIALSIMILPFLGLCVSTLFEYGSAMYYYSGMIFAGLFVFASPIGLVWLICLLRKKILFDGHQVTYIPAIGRKKTYNSRDIKVIKVSRNGMVEFSDEQSNTLFKYHTKNDTSNQMLQYFGQFDNVVFVFESCIPGEYQVDKSHFTLEHYLLTNEITFKYLEEDPDEEESEVIEPVVGPFSFKDYDINDTRPYDELPTDTINALTKVDRANAVVLIIVSLLYMILTYGMLAVLLQIDRKANLIDFVAYLILSAYFIRFVCLKIITNRVNKRFETLKFSFTKYRAEIIDDMSEVKENARNFRHVFKFTDVNGDVIFKADEETLPEDYVIGTDIGEQRDVWYSPYWDYVIVADELNYYKRKREKVSLKQYIKNHFVKVILLVISVFVIATRVYDIAEYFVFKTQNEEISIDFNRKSVKLTPGEEEWLKYSFYPYFYADCILDSDEYIEFDVEHFEKTFDEEQIDQMRESLSDGWGIDDRESLLKVTKKLLKAGDRYTYFDNLYGLSRERVTKDILSANEDAVIAFSNFTEMGKYKCLGTFYAYNNARNGVDAWDYCRCIRLYAFGYMCGYITYDEYLSYSEPIMTQTKKQYDSWVELYESYGYGYMIFLGRNDVDRDLKVYDYLNYEYYSEDVPISFE